MKTFYMTLIGIFQVAFSFAAPPDGMDGCRGSTKVISAKGIMEGWISSPGYSDGAYPPNLNCSYRIETFEGFVIRLYFFDLKLEVSDSCVRDKLIIREPRENGEDVILTYCGRETPLDYQTIGNVLEVRFITDEIGTNWGFRFRWNAVVAQDFCDIQLCGNRRHVDKSSKCDTFLCRNRRCVYKSSVCDGKDDCMDGTDEEDCDYTVNRNETCGIQKISPKTDLPERIIGGMEARAGSWPWLVDINTRSTFPSGHKCGGTLLNAQWVITASMCFEQLTNARDWRVKVGSHKKFEFNEGEQVRYVKRIVFYGMENTEVEDMKDEDLVNDIALVKLNAPVKMTQFVQPACLPDENLEPTYGTKCYSAGWGETRGTGHSDVLKQVVLPVLRNETCEAAFGDKFNADLMICAGNTGVMNALCSGDTGGPLMCQSKEKVWTVIGVAAVPSETTGTSVVCGLRNTPSVFHKVSKRVKWIRDIIEG